MNLEMPRLWRITVIVAITTIAMLLVSWCYMKQLEEDDARVRLEREWIFDAGTSLVRCDRFRCVPVVPDGGRTR